MLSDGELLEVLRHLSPRELLQCRAVCRRWRSLALHRSLWRNKSLSSTCDNYWNIHGALRLVPCLRRLDVHLRRDHLDQYAVLYTSTSCAVSQLFIRFDLSDSQFVAQVLNRQAALGRLKDVRLELMCSYSPYCPNASEWGKRRLRLLLKTLVYTEGLESIVLEVSQYDIDRLYQGATLPPIHSAAQDEVPVPASLWRLLYLSDFPDPYLHLYLEWHAATLEEVSMGACDARSLSLLTTMPRLWNLRCHVVEDMAQLRFPALETLHLYVPANSKPRSLAGAAAFLRTAVTQLEHLVLDYTGREERAEAVNLVLSLEGTLAVPAALRSLSIFDEGQSTWNHSTSLQLQPLTSIVHRLPHLTFLDIGCKPSDAFFAKLDGRVLPKLSVLKVVSGLICSHEWVHTQQVRMLMKRYPRLHVTVKPHSLDDYDCAFCKGAPRAEQCLTFHGEMCTYYSHPETVRCSVEHESYGMYVSLA